MKDTEIAPTLIYRTAPDKVELVALKYRGAWTPVVFMSPEQAEAFRSDWDLYPESEGFSVKDVEVDELQAIIEVWRYEHVAFCEPDRVSYLTSDNFIRIFEEIAAL
jgi:hypothetical protein